MNYITKFLYLALLFAFFSCKNDKANTDTTNTTKKTQVNDITAETAVANLQAKSGSKVSGEASFKTLEDGSIMYSISVKGLEPNSIHAIHIHEHGDCSSDDGKSAGGHWNPTGEKHGKWGEEHFHLGDIGNLESDDEGTANLSGTTDKWTINTSNANNIVNHAVIVHEKADDFETQPTGAAGSRIACGVIK